MEWHSSDGQLCEMEGAIKPLQHSVSGVCVDQVQLPQLLQPTEVLQAVGSQIATAWKSGAHSLVYHSYQLKGLLSVKDCPTLTLGLS